MKETHVELIHLNEKICPSLGGSGYLAPRGADSRTALMDSATEAAKMFPELNMVVWKVLNTSVDWSRPAKSRRLCIDGRMVPCEVIGDTGFPGGGRERFWYFVMVNATDAAKILAD